MNIVVKSKMKYNILKIHSIQKHHDLVQVYYENSTLNEEKIFNFLIYAIKNNKMIDNKFTTSHKEINNFLGFTINNQNLKNIFINMMKTILEVALLHKKKNSYKLTHFIKEVDYIGGNIIIELSTEYITMVLNDKDSYCKLNFALINNFKSKYTIRLYENIIRYTAKGDTFIHLPKMEINIFKKLMGITEDKYQRITHLKRSVIDIAVNEINAKTDIKVSYEFFKSGTTYEDILFHSKLNNKAKNILDSAFFASNEKLLDFIDIFLPKYADKKVVGFIDNKEVYFHKINNQGAKKLTFQDKYGKTILDMNIYIEVLTSCYHNRAKFKWFNKLIYEEFLYFQKEKKYQDNFK